MELWFTEKQLTDQEEASTVSFSVKIKEMLYRERTGFQEIAVFDTYEFGKMLVLDGIIQLTLADEFIYHEMITHVPLRAHPAPRSVLVVGGGDGGSVREISKYPAVERIVLAELDQKVIEVSRRFLPELGAAFSDPRVEVNIINGVDYVHSMKGVFDVVIVDSPDPLGPAEQLFGATFYQAVCEALTPDGIMVVQSESPFLNRRVVRQVCENIKQSFPGFYYYLAPVPTYPGSLWSFAVGSRQHNPLEQKNAFLPAGTRYYTPEVHQAAFVLPPIIRSIFG
ncbi:MAG: polyamine aminopropyltransferase [Bacillota bacterium]